MFPTNVEPTPVNFAAQNPEIQRRMWARKSMLAASLEDVYRAQGQNPYSRKPNEGSSILEVVEDTSKGEGQEITFPIDDEYYRRGMSGAEAPFSSTGQYNTDNPGYDKVRVDLKRLAASSNKYRNLKMGIVAEWIAGQPEKLGRQNGRKKTRDLMLTTINRVGAESRIFANGKTSVNSLAVGDRLEYADLLKGQGVMTTNGATPAHVTMDGNNNKVHGMHVLCTGSAYNDLKGDTFVQNLLSTAAPRERDTNPLIKGGLVNLDGHVIQWFNPVFHADAGEVASPQNPAALLGIAIGHASTPVTTAEAITGGRNTTWANDTEIEYFQDFPLFAYKFWDGTTQNVTDTVTTTGPYYTNNDPWGYRAADPSGWASAPYFYVRITNPWNAAVQPGRWSIYKISANNGNRLTMAARLGPTASGIQVTTVGTVAYSAGYHATYHGPESLVSLCNAAGVNIGCSSMHGASALRRATGMWDGERNEDVVQGIYKFCYLDTIMGHNVRRDRSFRAVGVMNIVHAIEYPGWNSAVA